MLYIFSLQVFNQINDSQIFSHFELIFVMVHGVDCSSLFADGCPMAPAPHVEKTISISTELNCLCNFKN